MTLVPTQAEALEALEGWVRAELTLNRADTWRCEGDDARRDLLEEVLQKVVVVRRGSSEADEVSS